MATPAAGAPAPPGSGRDGRAWQFAARRCLPPPGLRVRAAVRVRVRVCVRVRGGIGLAGMASVRSRPAFGQRPGSDEGDARPGACGHLIRAHRAHRALGFLRPLLLGVLPRHRCRPARPPGHPAPCHASPVHRQCRGRGWVGYGVEGRFQIGEGCADRGFLFQEGGEDVTQRARVGGEFGFLVEDGVQGRQRGVTGEGEWPARAAQSVAPRDHTSEGGPAGGRRCARGPCSRGNRRACRPWSTPSRPGSRRCRSR